MSSQSLSYSPTIQPFFPFFWSFRSDVKKKIVNELPCCCCAPQVPRPSLLFSVSLCDYVCVCALVALWICVKDVALRDSLLRRLVVLARTLCFLPSLLSFAAPSRLCRSSDSSKMVIFSLVSRMYILRVFPPIFFCPFAHQGKAFANRAPLSLLCCVCFLLFSFSPVGQLPHTAGGFLFSFRVPISKLVQDFVATVCVSRRIGKSK